MFIVKNYDMFDLLKVQVIIKTALFFFNYYDVVCAKILPKSKMFKIK